MIMKNLKKIFITLLVLGIFILPAVSLAQGIGTDVTSNRSQTSTQNFANTTSTSGGKLCSADANTIGAILCKSASLLRTVIPVLITLGVVYFIFGIVTYVIGSDEEAKKRGKDRIIYGLIGFVMIFGLEGLIAITINTFGLDSAGSQLVTDFTSKNTSITEANITGTCSLPQNSKLGDLLNYATCNINDAVIPLLFSLAVAMFVWGVVQYVINSDEEAKKEKGKQFMIWGIIGLAVMIGVWGLVHILSNTFHIDYAIPKLKQ